MPASIAPPPLHPPPPRRTGRPSTQEGGQLDREILDTAHLLFGRHGFAATSIDAIAAACGTTRRSIYHRHPDKEALFAAVCRRHCTHFVDSVIDPDETEADGDPMMRLRDLCWTVTTQALRPGNIAFHAHCSGEIGKRPELAAFAMTAGNMLEQRLERRIMQVQRAGYFQRFSAAALATMIVGVLLSNPINRATMGDPEFLDPHRIELYFSRNWSTLVAMG